MSSPKLLNVAKALFM